MEAESRFHAIVFSMVPARKARRSAHWILFPETTEFRQDSSQACQENGHHNQATVLENEGIGNRGVRNFPLPQMVFDPLRAPEQEELDNLKNPPRRGNPMSLNRV